MRILAAIMITIISGTHRPNSNSFKTAKAYASLLDGRGEESQILDLEKLPRDFLWHMFDDQSIEWKGLIQKYLQEVERLIIITPEYNGSYPGIMKLFLDALDPKIMRAKHIALTGIASGRFGNQRGLDDLTMVLHHVNANVLPQKVLIPAVYEQFDAQGDFKQDQLLERVNDQLDHLLG